MLSLKKIHKVEKFKSDGQEMCPIFFCAALKPKKNFNQNLEFDISKVFSIERIKSFNRPDSNAGCTIYIVS